MFYLAIYNFYNSDPEIVVDYDDIWSAINSYYAVKDVRADDDAGLLLYTENGNIVFGF